MRAAVKAAVAGQTVRQAVELKLPIGPRRFDFTIRPVFNARGELAGLVPEGLDITDAR